MRLLPVLAILIATAPPAVATPLVLTRHEAPGFTTSSREARVTVARVTHARRSATAFVQGAGAHRLVLRSEAYPLTTKAAARRALSAARRSIGAGSAVTALGDGGFTGTLRLPHRRGWRLSVVWRHGSTVALVAIDAPARNAAFVAAAVAYARVVEGRAHPPTTAEGHLAAATHNGDVPLALALQAFRYGIGPVPGVQAPRGWRGAIDGTSVIGSILDRFDHLTVPQRDAVLAAIDTFSGRSKPASRGRRASWTPDAADQAIADGYAAKIAIRLGVPLALSLEVGRAVGTPKVLASTQTYDADGKRAELTSAPLTSCQITVGDGGQALTADGLRETLAHEVFHCFQRQTVGSGGPSVRLSGEAWLREGMADWVGFSLVPTDIDDADVAGIYTDGWLGHPEVALFDRTYAAAGFFGLMEEVGGEAGVWSQLVAMLKAPDSTAAYNAAGTLLPFIEISWGPRTDRLPTLGPDWTIHRPIVGAGDGRTTFAHTITPVIGNGFVAAPSYTATHYVLIGDAPSAPLLHLEIEGRARLSDGAAIDTTQLTDTWFCVTASCACPAGLEPDATVKQLKVPANLALAGGGDTTGTGGAVSSVTLKEFCHRKPPPVGPSPGGSGPPASSNGDPHLTTFDGLHYDFQAAGEFVLVRSATGDLEIQARQERWRTSRKVTIDTQFAMRLAGHVVVIRPGMSGETATVDGAVVTPAAGARLAVGTGWLARDPLGPELTATWPDGSTATIRPVGSWGLAISITLAAGRHGAVSGLLGDGDGSPANDLPGVQFTPTVLSTGYFAVTRPTPKDPHVFFHSLYGAFAARWRIRQQDSILLYASGQSTRTFTDTTVPDEPVDQATIDAAKRAAAERICRAQGVTEVPFLADCILDVWATGKAEFAAAAAAAQEASHTSWTQLATSPDRSGPISFLRTGDGVLHLAYGTRVAGSPPVSALIEDRLTPTGEGAGRSTISGDDSRPRLFTAPDGSLRAIAGVIGSTRDGAMVFGSAAPWGAWSELGATADTNFAYAGDPQGLFAPDGTLLTLSGANGYARVYRGFDPPAQGVPVVTGGPCASTAPAIASDGTTVWVAWIQSLCTDPGVYYAPLDPATGALAAPATKAPLSSWTVDGGGQFELYGQALSLAVRKGGGVYLAYATERAPRDWGVELLRLGTTAPVTVGTVKDRPTSVQVAASASGGHVWVAWQGPNDYLSLARTDEAATTTDGATRHLGRPAGAIRDDSTTWTLVPDGQALEVFTGYPRPSDTVAAATWRTVVPDR